MALMRLPGYDTGSPLLNLNPLNQAIQFGAQQQQRGFENDRALKREKMAQEQFDMAKQDRMIKQAGNLALAVINDPDPARGQANFQKFLSMVPGAAEDLAKNGLDAQDYMTAARAIAAKAGVLPDPLEQKKSQAQLDLIREQTANAGLQGKMTQAQLDDVKRQSPEWRIENAARFGFNPSAVPGTNEHNAYRAFIVSGQLLPSKSDESTLDKEVAKARVEMAQKDITSAVGAQGVGAVLDQLETIGKDPNIGAAIGPMQGTGIAQTAGNMLPFGQTFGLANPKLNSDIRRLQSQLVLAGGEKMKGLGAQSDADAARLQEAIGNLTSARDATEFNNALAIIRSSISGSLQRGQLAAKEFPTLGGGRIDQPKLKTDPSPPVSGAKQAPDGKWYVPDPNRPGKYLMVQP